MKCNPNGCKDWTSLHLAARNARTSVVELLIKRMANVNAAAEEDKMQQGTFGPAYLASYYGHMAEVKLLLDNGAKMEGSNEEHYLLQGAVKNNQHEMVKYLLGRGAAINAQDSQKCSALHFASSLGFTSIVVELLLNSEYPNEKRIDVNSADVRGNTALHEAASRGHKDIAFHLLASGANPKIRNVSGRTPVDEALKNGKKELGDDIMQEAKRLKCTRIQNHRFLMLKVERQQEELKKHKEMLNAQAVEIENLKRMLTELSARNK